MKHRTIVRHGLAVAIKAAGINDDPDKPKLRWHDLRHAKLLDAADQDERATAILEEAVMERDLENGDGKQPQTPKPRNPANVRVLAKTVGGGDR